MCFISVEQSTDTQGVCFLFLPENIPFPTIIEYKNPLYVFPDSSGRGRERYLLIITVRRIKRKSLPYKSVIVINALITRLHQFLHLRQPALLLIG